MDAVLLQKISNKWKSVAFASKTMSETECHYVQIKKEALATYRYKYSDNLLPI